MDLRRTIKSNLLDFIGEVCSGKEGGFAKEALRYGDGKGLRKEFYRDVERAVDAILGMSQYEFTNVYKNLRDSKPRWRGVLVGERMVSFEGDCSFQRLEESRHSDFPAEEFVYEWAEHALSNPYYADLLSHFVQYTEKTVDAKGCLTGLLFQTRSFTYVLITDSFEFLPVRVDEIYIQFANGNELPLYRYVGVKEECYIEDLQEFLMEIVDMGTHLRLTE